MKLFKILILLATVASARGAMVASPLTTNAWLTYSNRTDPLRLTNVSLWGYGTVFSNSITSGVPSAPVPAFQPSGGSFYGLTVVNSSTITNEQAALGLLAANAGTYSNMTFYDGVFSGTGTNGDAVYFNSGATFTNQVSFYNCQFLSRHWAFNSLAVGTFRFYNCLFQAIGPAQSGESVAFLPDAGPQTNYLYGCHLIARNGGSLTLPLLIQVHSYNFLFGCTIEATTTNASNDAIQGVAYSAEGDYYTVFNSCFFHVSGGSTNYVADLSGGGARAIMVLNNCFWDGAYGPVVIENSNQDTTSSLTVSGGNFVPANFSVPAAVTWQSPYGNAVNVSAFLVKTNFVQGFIYTNFYGAPIEVNANIRVTTAAVAGDADMDLQQPAGTLAARVGLQSVAAQTNECHLIWKIPANGTYAITNTLTTGSGNAVIVIGGQIFVY